MEKVVNIIGMGWGATSAPWKNEHEEFWGINNAYIYGKLTRLFMMHHPEQTIKSSFLRSNGINRDILSLRDAFKIYPDMKTVSLDEIVFCYNLKTEKYAIAPKEKLDNLQKDDSYEILTVTERYPLGKATVLAGTTDFASSAPYLIAMAILEKFDRIRLYGFEVWSGTNQEYIDEAPCIERWQKIAKGMGIQMDISFDVIPTIRDKNSAYGYINK